MRSATVWLRSDHLVGVAYRYHPLFSRAVEWPNCFAAGGGGLLISEFYTILPSKRQKGTSACVYVFSGDGDRRLMFDLDNPAHRTELASIARSSKSIEIALTEAIPSPQEMWFSSPQGCHAAEFVVPLLANSRKRMPSTNTPGTVSSLAPIRGSSRLRAPGSEWLFAKFYVPPILMENVLLDEVAPMADTLTQTGQAAFWYFVRYSDPEPHLRVRLKATSHATTSTIIETVGTLIQQLNRGTSL